MDNQVNLVNPYEIIAEHFWDLLDDCLTHKYTHYWLKGR